MYSLEYFGNDIYKILKILHDNQITVKTDKFAPLSQQEIADIAQFSKVKINHLLNELINYGFVEIFQNKRGKYALTNKGDEAITIMMKQR